MSDVDVPSLCMRACFAFKKPFLRMIGSDGTADNGDIEQGTHLETMASEGLTQRRMPAEADGESEAVGNRVPSNGSSSSRSNGASSLIPGKNTQKNSNSVHP